jgi:hypothetical protein
MTDDEINKELERLGYDPECSCANCAEVVFIAKHFANFAAIAEQEKAEPVAVLQTDYIGRFLECVYRGQILPADQWGWEEETRVSKGKFIPLYAHPAPVPAGWQPIETAPKDGDVMLLGLPAIGALKDDNQRRVYEGRWNHDQNRFTSVNGFIVLDCATHWMLLPAAPKTGAR